MIDWLERGNAYLLDRLRGRIAGEITLVEEPTFAREHIDVAVVQA